ncbi:hypothetical protein H0H93_011554 [Arthromyces matolae]|nr:hypothetical protein H0H93_011554 [Arthromyces matolae]
MASFSSSSVPQRRPPLKRQSSSRRNSSFLTSLKSLVTAPLAWFASTDDFEDTKDFQGKRRRLAEAPSQPIVDHGERLGRNKRMRVHSPSRDEPYSQPQAPDHGYLDPPGSVFHQQGRQSSPLFQHNSTRSLSFNHSYDLGNNTALPRTMSIDPPNRRPLSRLSAASIPLSRGVSVNSSTLVRQADRDLSMPPLSGQPSFLVRTSMTPQPLRDFSEPPPLHSLKSQPAFVRAPTVKALEFSPNTTSESTSATLGSLVQSVRSRGSPVRQHSSLAFFKPDIRHDRSSPLPETIIEKALHELDIYKTPLVPTRLRSANASGTTSSDNMFKSRRASNLVLIQNGSASDRLGRKVSGQKDSPLPNETKPYAGEGGMKRLLAKRKREVDETKSQVTTDEIHMDDDLQVSHQKLSDAIDALHEPSITTSSSVNRASEIPSIMQSSSLRVGRTKSRNHIARPVRPTKMKFSAAFDDETMEDVDEMDEQTVQRRKEIDALEEAAKHVPAFKIPAGFTFARELPPTDNHPVGGTEHVVTALPFSLTAASLATAQKLSVQPESKRPSQSSASSTSGISSLASAPPSAGVSLLPPTPDTMPLNATKTMAPVASTNRAVDAIPNFFTSSAALSRPMPPLPSIPEVTNFFSTSSTMSTPGRAPPLSFNPSSSPSNNPPVPVKDRDNPLWEGESKVAVASRNDPQPFAPLETGSESISKESTKSALEPAISLSTISPSQSSILGEVPPLAQFSFSNTTASTFLGGAGDQSNPSKLSATTTSPSLSNSITSLGNRSLATTTILSPMSGTLPTSELSQENMVAFAHPQSTISSPLASLKPDEAKHLFGHGQAGAQGKSVGFSGALINEETEQRRSPEFSFGAAGVKEQRPESTTFGKAGGDEKLIPAHVSFAFSKPERQDINNTFSVGTKTEPKSASSPFAFLSASNTPAPTDVNRSSHFNFRGSGADPAPNTAAAIGFSLDGGVKATPAKSFTFEQSSSLARPVTPPKSQDFEVNMDESPTRDNEPAPKLADRPTLGATAFSFTPNTSSPFGSQSQSTAASFSFGTSPNPFGKSVETNAFPFGQAASSVSTGFQFAQSKPENEALQHSTTGPFSFTAPASTVNPAPVFLFGGPGNNSIGNGFGSTQSGSAPGSPSTFNQQQPSPFSFGSPLPPVNTAFTFGSQPASPAAVNLSLPQPATTGGFGTGSTSGFDQLQSPSSPFSTPSAIAPPAGGSSLFTIGAAPSPQAAPNSRTIRKLPTRRGGAKR